MGGAFRRLRVVLPLALLVMILMRLIWMQLRSYPVFFEGRAVHALGVLEAFADEACSYDPSFPESAPWEETGQARAAHAWLMSPGYAAFGYLGCLAGVLEDRPIVRLNQWLLATTVLIAVVMTRFVTSSWTMGLIVGAMLMSRGRLLADIGQVSVNFPAMLVVTTWLAASAHFLRTGAWVSLAAAAVFAVVGTLVDRSLACLALVSPVMLGAGYVFRRQLAKPVLQRLRGARERQERLAAVVSPMLDHGPTAAFGRLVGSARWLLGMDDADPETKPPPKPGGERGSLFRTLDTPFLLWIYARRRWLRLSFGWTVVFAASVVSSFALFLWLGGPEAFGRLMRVTPSVWAAMPELGESWRLGLMDRFDFHLTMSLFVVVYCAVQSPAAGLTGFLEAVWLTLLGGVLVGAAAFVVDAYDVAMAASFGGLGAPLLARPVALWFEPALLALGAAGVYNLMKVLDTRIAERR